jgi:hypothetical protein
MTDTSDLLAKALNDANTFYAAVQGAQSSVSQLQFPNPLNPNDVAVDSHGGRWSPKHA